MNGKVDYLVSEEEINLTRGPSVLKIKPEPCRCQEGLYTESYPNSLLVVGGCFCLREFSQIRYDAVKIKIDPELEKRLKMNKVSLELEYEKIKDSTFEDWKNIRGPRCWEDANILQGQNPETIKSKTN